MAKRKITEETAIKKTITEYLKYTGWFTFHLMAGMGSYPGSPDRIAVRNGVVLFIEIKARKGKMSDYQKEFQKDIEEKNGIYLCVHSVEELEKHIYNITGERSLLIS